MKWTPQPDQGHIVSCCNAMITEMWVWKRMDRRFITYKPAGAMSHISWREWPAWLHFVSPQKSSWFPYQLFNENAEIQLKVPCEIIKFILKVFSSVRRPLTEGCDDDDTTDSWFYNIESNFSEKDLIIVRFGFVEKHIGQLMVKTLRTNSEIWNILYF